MKKLMLFVAVAGLAVASQAAALDWKYNATSADVGKTVYVLLGTPTTTWDSVDAVAAASVDNGTVVKKVNKYLASGSTDKAAITADSAKSVYYVVVSADKSTFDVSSAADMSASVYDPTDPNNSTSPGQDTSISSSSTFVATGSSFGGGGTTPVVPEPTSGLLMIVGLGALALRRRRA